jgi:hypothetical protein
MTFPELFYPEWKNDLKKVCPYTSNIHDMVHEMVNIREQIQTDIVTIKHGGKLAEAPIPLSPLQTIIDNVNAPGMDHDHLKAAEMKQEKERREAFEKGAGDFSIFCLP